MGRFSNAASAAGAAAKTAGAGLDSTTLIIILVTIGVLLIVAILVSVMKAKKKKAVNCSEDGYGTPEQERPESSYMTEVIRNSGQRNLGAENSVEEPHRPLVGDSQLWLSPGRYERLSPPSPAMTPAGSPRDTLHSPPGWRPFESQGRVVAVNSDSVGLLSGSERTNRS